MKKLIALLSAFAMIFTLAACGKTASEEPTAAPETEAVVTDAATEAETEAVSEEFSEDASEAETEAETEAEVTEAVEAKAHETTEEVVKLYNDAVNAAFDAKAGFSKVRYTDNEDMSDMSVTLKAFKSLVQKFIGIGAENKYTETVAKGNWDSDSKKAYLRKSTLTVGDVSSATCTLENGVYNITLSVKNGNSVGNKNAQTANAPIDKCGICVGNEDKGYYDHKTGPVIYDAISGTYASAKIDESYSNAKVYAKVDAATGNITSLKVEYNIKVAIDIGIGKGNATGITHIIYSDFKF